MIGNQSPAIVRVNKRQDNRQLRDMLEGKESEIYTNTRKKQISMTQNSLVRKIDRYVIKANPGN